MRNFQFLWEKVPSIFSFFPKNLESRFSLIPRNVGLSVRLTLPHNAAKLIFFYKSPTLLERFNLTQKAAL